jgi:hypothetical protein
MSEQAAEGPRESPLREAVRQARIEMAERTGVIVDLRDAELARLELLNEKLEPIYAELPRGIDLIDRGIVPGDPPRLFIDMVASVTMARDKRVYQFTQDTRYGRRILAESGEPDEIVAAVTKYVARRLIERERILVSDAPFVAYERMLDRATRRRRFRRAMAAFLAGVVFGAAALFAIAWIFSIN